jgi:hypothetical protein
MRTRVASLALAVSLVAICDPLFGHHGNVAYDESKIVVLKEATVTKFIWANPHNLILFDMKDSNGQVTHWSVEGGSPSALSNLGWTRNSVQPGDVITVYLTQSKLHTPAGRLTQIVLADGTVLKDSSKLREDGSYRDKPTN